LLSRHRRPERSKLVVAAIPHRSLALRQSETVALLNCAGFAAPLSGSA